MFLIIDSSQNNCLKIILADGGDSFKINKIKIGQRSTDQLIGRIDACFGSYGSRGRKISGVAAVTGPGGFTNLRIGIAVANALAYAWGLPIAGFASGEFSDDAELVKKAVNRLKRKKKFIPIVPAYGREPNIG